MLRVGIASDHRGVHIKARLLQTLTAAGFDVSNEGTDSSEPVDYPDFAMKVAGRISNGELDRGILICGTGIGMSIAANKFPGVRAALCYDEVMVEISRRHNDVNVLCLPGDLIGERPIDDLVLMWLRTEFEAGRHGTRVDKICSLESTVNTTSEQSTDCTPAQKSSVTSRAN
ncbi:ribose 5-phosphate isomerase B [Aporhodopirellula aestuarii]|uniref:ribose 5-phosphate isomerase B n=1 Tax=Aporhodopirellula aestuarii TaxID=2950107 RepID=UPI003898F98E